MKPSFYFLIVIMIMTIPKAMISSHNIPSYQRSTISSRLHAKVRSDNHSHTHNHSRMHSIVHKEIITQQQTVKPIKKSLAQFDTTSQISDLTPIKTSYNQSENYSQISDLTDDHEYSTSTESAQEEKNHTMIEYNQVQDIWIGLDPHITPIMYARLQKYGII